MADATLDLATVWDQIRERLATSLSPQQNAMLNLTRPLGLVEDTAVLAAPNEFTQTVLESRMRRVLAEALSEQFGRDIRVAVQLEDAPEEPPSEDADDRSRPAGRGPPAEAQRAEEDRATRDRADDGRSAFGVRTDARRHRRLGPRRRAAPARPRRRRPARAAPGHGAGPAGRPRRARGLEHHDVGAGPRRRGRHRGWGGLGPERRRPALRPRSPDATGRHRGGRRARPPSETAGRPGWTRA